MTKQEIWAVARDQLALDLGCEAILLDSPDNAVIEWRELPGRRKYRQEAPFLELAIWNGKLIAAVNPMLLPWARKYLLPQKAEWLFQPDRLRDIGCALAPYGCHVEEARHFDLPVAGFPTATPLCSIRWYEGQEIELFRGDGRWNEAFAFRPDAPDLLAVAALDGSGDPIAMAGASRDGERLWQIGVNVLPSAKRRGLGTNLTALLKDELLCRGIVPFYHTEGSHIASLNVGLNAGFRPAFGYLYATRIAQVKG